MSVSRRDFGNVLSAIGAHVTAIPQRKDKLAGSVHRRPPAADDAKRVMISPLRSVTRGTGTLARPC